MMYLVLIKVTYEQARYVAADSPEEARAMAVYQLEDEEDVTAFEVGEPMEVK